MEGHGDRRTFMEGLIGLTVGGWLRLMIDNRFAVSRRYFRRALQLLVFSLRTSRFVGRERRVLGGKLKGVSVPPPIFVLGHWRSGTTLVHNALCVDARFGYPNMFQVSQPHIFVCLNDRVQRHLRANLPEKRAMDDVEVHVTSPGEDEVALAMMTLCSPMVGWTFPRNSPRYDRYLTFKDVPENERARWKEAFMEFMKKLTFLYRKPMILKSPPHTARIPLLLELFPEARFVHVCRDPVAVFQSTVSLYQRSVKLSQLQFPDKDAMIDEILRRYRIMYDAYFTDRHLIPRGRLAEIRYEDFEGDIVEGVRQVHSAIGLDNWDVLRPRVEEFAVSQRNFRKNRYGEIDTGLRSRIVKEWKRSFDEWGYPS